MPKPNKKSTAQIRIIAGRWRGSRLPVIGKSGLRPTPDRIRETVFNWLAQDIPGARVLDCFAGAGGLGFEAASREAKQVTLVELDKQAANNLCEIKKRLEADNLQVHQHDINAYLQSKNERFDIVFIDPPYDNPALRMETLQQLIDKKWLAENAKIYLEWPINKKDQQDFELIHEKLTWVKQKKAGQVVYAIAQWRSNR